jgi:hypothetical protein
MISAGLASNGTVSQSVVDELHEAQQTLNTAAVEEAFQAWLDEPDSNADVPDIDRILDQDFDGQVNSDCLPADPERWTGHADHDGDGRDHIGAGGDDCARFSQSRSTSPAPRPRPRCQPLASR